MFPTGQRTLPWVLEYRAQAHPDRPALIFESASGEVTRFTYGELDATVNQLANALRELGVGHESKVNLHLPNSMELYLFWFALSKLGAVSVPTNILNTAADMAYILSHSESVATVTEPAYVDVVETARRSAPNVKHQIIARSNGAPAGWLQLEKLIGSGPTTSPGLRLVPTDELAMMYTSGTTAKPKGVLVTHASYLFAGESLARHIRVTSEDRWIIVLPLFHANALYYSTCSALSVGASFAVMDRFSASRFWDQAIRHEATLASLFAAPLRMLLAQPRNPAYRHNRLRIVVYAQNINPAQEDEWHERFGAPLCQLYGMTETMAPNLINPMDFPRKNQSIGLPTLGQEIKLVDETGQEVETGQIGQITVRGVPGWTIMKGYFKNPEATADTIRDGWLYTGDNAYLDDEGYHYFVDRRKDMIKRGGENVAASEVEAVINQHPAVFESAVIGIPDPIRDESIKAFVILKENATATEGEIIEWCRTRLAKFRVPEQVELRSEFPRTSVGKIQKHILRSEELAKVQ